MTATMIPYRSTAPAGSDGFRQLVRAEWTKFRTVRGWLIGSAAAALFMVGFGLLASAGSHSTYSTTPDSPTIVGHPYVPIGPGGEAVSDSFYFVHQSLDGDGSITARVSSLTGAVLGNVGVPAGPDASTPIAGGAQPWAKAGLIIKQNTSRGSAYVAIMVTGGHGVRMQYNYTGDIAGPTGTVSATSPRWLRLTRSGDTFTGSSSADGSTWTAVGTVHLTGLPSTTQAGLFVTSPAKSTFDQHLGGGTGSGVPTVATAALDTIGMQGNWPARTWTGAAIGADPGMPRTMGGFQQTNGAYTVTGSGDIAPDAGDSGTAVERTLVGAFAALTVMVVLGVLFISTEYRRGLIRTSLTVSPRRGRVLAAKAIVMASVTFVTGLLAAAVAIPISERILRANGNFIYPITALTEARLVAGTAALLGVAAVLALAVGAILRRSAATVAAVIVLVVLPYILATAGVLPAGPSQWLLRVTPAAGFAIQQSLPAYSQVDHAYTPLLGYYPLAPWAGFAVLCAWTALALGTAMYLLRRRDA
jgi:ABC-type transport system involved in multi-copper enzyme maturation permease subunit